MHKLWPAYEQSLDLEKYVEVRPALTRVYVIRKLMKLYKLAAEQLLNGARVRSSFALLLQRTSTALPHTDTHKTIKIDFFTIAHPYCKQEKLYFNSL